MDGAKGICMCFCFGILTGIAKLPSKGVVLIGTYTSCLRARASQSHQQHLLSSLWVSACLLGGEWDVGLLALKLHFSNSENH